MKKIKIYCVYDEDFRCFDLIYDNVEMIFVENVDQLLSISKFEDDIICANQFQFLTNVQSFRNFLKTPSNNFLLINYYECGSTMLAWLEKYELMSHARSGQIHMMCQGTIPPDTNILQFNRDNYLDWAVNDYNIIMSINNFDKIFTTSPKKYTFLCLNGNPRPYRTKLIDSLEENDLLDNAIWSYHHKGKRFIPEGFEEIYSRTNEPTKARINRSEFDVSFSTLYVSPDLYINTYFSVISETNYTLPANNYTEKIYKNLLMGHPFIVVTNSKFYKNLHDRGFKTFGHLIDESFDDIENNDDRLAATVNSIKSLCSSDLDSFLVEAKDICEYNRQHLLELAGTYKLRIAKPMTEFLHRIAQNT